MRVSLNNDTVNSDYFIYLFQGGGSVKDQVRELCKESTRNFLNQTILSSIIFPLPSLIEQEQIVCEIENCLFIIEQLEEEIKQNLQKAEALRQSILKKAFSGQLVLQDSNDEPASILLERIRAECEQQKLKSTKFLSRRSGAKRSVELNSALNQQLTSLHQPDVPIVPSRQLS
jgi:type I restriction enzyme S subunit